MNSIRFILISFFIIVIASVSLFSNNKWDTNIYIGYKCIPGKYYYFQGIESYINGVGVPILPAFEQGEVNSNLELLTLRFSFLKPQKIFNFGLETGIDLPIKKTINKWFKPATFNYTGITRFPRSDFGISSPNADDTYTKEISTIAFPLLVKFSKRMLNKGNLNFDLGLNIGEYLIFQKIETFEMFESKVNIGSTYNLATRDINIYSKIIAEFNPEVKYKLKDNCFIGIFGDIGYIPKFEMLLEEDTNTFKTKYEFGGLTYGGGLNFNLDF
ncbi:MAG: hypothetical protein A2539_08260 [Elusimicrobia bacterium RIFOXYD2_FULL_34_15]|nr:MAG: hypothetical protein A2539_08260 [Elusimicrobia bacterium RIFOXYD2_FULL_34_15]